MEFRGEFVFLSVGDGLLGVAVPVVGADGYGTCVVRSEVEVVSSGMYDGGDVRVVRV